MLDFLNVIIPGCSFITEELVRTLVVLIGLVSIFLTFNLYNCKLLRIVFVVLGTVGLLALLLFLFAGSIQSLGLFGTIGLVVSFHALVLPEIAIQLRKLNFCKRKGKFHKKY